MIIWISSYPRSGNTFVRTLLHRCLGQSTYSIYNDTDIGADPGLTGLTGHKALTYNVRQPEFDLRPMRTNNRIFFLKTHERSRDLVQKGDRVIYILRDGREASVSYQKYLTSFWHKEVPLADIILGLEYPGTWAEHVANWSPKENDDTLLLYFERLIKRPDSALRKLSSFIGIPISSRSVPSFDELKNINHEFFRSGNVDSFKKSFNVREQFLFTLLSYPILKDFRYLTGLPTKLKMDHETLFRSVAEEMQTGLHRVHEATADTTARSISGKNKELRQRDAQIADQKKSLEQKDKQSSTLLQERRERDTKIANLTNSLKNLTNSLANLTNSLEQKERQIADLSSSLEQKDKQSSTLLQERRERDTRIANLTNSLEQKGRQIADLSSSLEQKEKQSSTLLQECRERDTKIANLTNSLKRKGKEASTFLLELHQRDQLLTKQRANLASYKRNIDSMCRSRSWKLTAPLRSIRLYFRTRWKV